MTINSIRSLSFNGFYNPRICFKPEPVEDPENKKPDLGGFTEDQVKFFGGIVNQVVTSHLKRQPAFEDQLKAVKWEDLLSPVLQKIVPTPTEADEKKNKNKPELSDYEKQLAKLTEDMKKLELAKAEAENKAKTSEMARRVDAGKSKLRSALSTHVNDGALEHVINHLTVVNNRMTVEEDGTVKIRVKRPEFVGMPPTDMDVPVDEAIKDLLSESEMKIFLPVPKGSTGGNPGPGKTIHSSQFTGEAKTAEEKALRSMVREKELAEKYGYR